MKRYSAHVYIFLAICTKAYRIIQEERALGMHNLSFMHKCCDFFSCRPVKYTRLPVQQVKIHDKQFPFVIFGLQPRFQLVIAHRKYRSSFQLTHMPYGNQWRPKTQRSQLCQHGEFRHVCVSEPAITAVWS